MKGQKTLFSSAHDIWTTPKDLYLRLNNQYGPFTLDAAASAENALCDMYYDEMMDALQQPWPGRVFCNPPFSKWQKFVAHGYKELIFNNENESITFLLPARTDTHAFHGYIWDNERKQPHPHVKTLEFIYGRLKFGDSKNSAPFPSMVVVFNGVIYKEVHDS